MKILKNIQKILDIPFDSINTIGNRPKNLTKQNLPLITSNYSVSIKADGLRCFLYYDDSIYSILQPFVEKKIKKSIFKTNKNVKGIYLLDCEYIEKIDTYYIFDILICESKDVRNYTLNERIKLINKDLLSSNIKLKDIYNLKNDKNIFKISKKIYKKKYDYETDGLIYTPIYESYSNYYIFKWKPLNQQTIDFLIREIKQKNKEKTYALFVSSNNNNIKNKLLKDKEYMKLFPFITKENKYIPSYFTPSPYTTLKLKTFSNNGNTYGNYNNILIKDNTIVEFYYDLDEEREEFRWKPSRIRLDKTEGYLENYSKQVYDVTKGPNSWRTSINIYNYIKDPIDTEILFGDKLIENDYYLNIKKKGLKIPLYKYNNYIKKYLYDTYLKKGYKLLDLAGGRGGDLLKTVKSSYILHIDIVDKLLKEAKNRYNKINYNKINYNKPEINFLKFDLLGNNISKINKIKKTDKFDIISCQFAFHYFCKNKKSIDYIISLINNNLKENGIFIMTGYDGKKIFEKLKEKSYIDYKWNNILFSKIIKKYNDEKFKNYGQEINVFIEKIGIPQDEFLINFDYLHKQFNKYNINVIEEEYFDSKINNFNKKLSEEEINYINLHKYIVYQKK